ncbi:MAG: LytTR family transcriptional regulator [Cyclobacteriaceae bacterium]|nr:LytTR family transcriptional regulator [Cyclobacteriaceae bacterium]
MQRHDTIQVEGNASFFKRITESASASLRAPFPFYLNDNRKNFVLVFVISVFVTGFLYLFKTPSDNHFSEGLEWMHGCITFVCLTINIILLPRIFPAMMDPVNWTFKKYLVLNMGHLFLIWAACTLVEKPLFCPGLPWLLVASHVGTQVALKGIIPIAFTTLFLKAHLLQENLREAITANQELQKIQTLKKDAPKADNQITLYSDTSESLSFNLPDLLFIEADDNYSTVTWKSEEGIQKKLLRVNLKNIESQLNNSFAIRCHRSFIVNVNAISAISGNTNGYKLKINDTDFFIPVSRPKGKEVMEKISQLRNMMELS